MVKIDVKKIMGTLKDFQRETVEYVFDRMYGPSETKRFLVADEVGLGKTFVAKGIIAKAVEKLSTKVKRVDVIYVCSNASIARQNIARLNVLGRGNAFHISTRLTLLAKQARELSANKVNFIALTPATTFGSDYENGKGNTFTGLGEERALIYQIVSTLLTKNKLQGLKTGLKNLLQCSMQMDGWEREIQKAKDERLEPSIVSNFKKALGENDDLMGELQRCCEKFERRGISWPEEARQARNQLIAKLRTELATLSLEILEPDLIIMDEFQSFKHLLEGFSDGIDSNKLVSAFFNYKDSKVLLLSATPYKFFTTALESADDDHFTDFIQTLSFLCNDTAKVDEIKTFIRGHRHELRALAQGLKAEPGVWKAELEKALLKVMCRTERVSQTLDRNAMLTEVIMPAPLESGDLLAASAADRAARAIGSDLPLDYWKSTPFLFNFLKGYQFREKLGDFLASPEPGLTQALLSPGASLTEKDLRNFKPIKPNNPRARALFKDTLGAGLWRLLWMPPSLPYHEPSGVYGNMGGVTKSLVFSSWKMVPASLSATLSYEAERLQVGGNLFHQNLGDQVARLLTFSRDSGNRRLTGMPIMAWLMPCPALARKVDPLAIAGSFGGRLPSLRRARDAAIGICKGLLAKLPAGPKTGTADQRWYWAAPVFLSGRDGLRDWLDGQGPDGWGALAGEAVRGEIFNAHLDLLRGTEASDLGRMPADLAEVLADLALGGPGNCALRALAMAAPELDPGDPRLLTAAANVSFGFLNLFNLPETVTLLQGLYPGKGAYWRDTLKYAIDGNVQAVLDEYVHVLLESLPFPGDGPAERVMELSGRIKSTLTLRTSQATFDVLQFKGDKFVIRDYNSRCRFSLKYDKIVDIEESESHNEKESRVERVAEAFNSPFRPFVLASTSIGQEGLDFHPWCHAVVHWNLPSNPVDLEQREGRVQRYKGHAVRKNVARRYGLKSLPPIGKGKPWARPDPWQAMFDQALRDREKGRNDITPYWVFDGEAKIERRIPMIPFSREVGRLRELKRDLATYRLVFGQPRQEELLAALNLGRPVDEMSGWLISLAPPKKR
ncbi:MAG: DEAD/DEAH box helicase [Deltaproteobacteria bacterium]|nr:DEAD/DEAH box helicase [Deltaproteobacteria bacterium]